LERSSESVKPSLRRCISSAIYWKEVNYTNNETAARLLLQKVREVQEVEDCGITEDGDEMAEGDVSASRSESEQDERIKRVHRLQQEFPTRWNSCLAMMKSLL